MASLDFPSSPTIGQQYSANGSTWTWDGVSWLAVNGPASGFSGFSGFSGYSGFSGFSGVGSSGVSGISGYSGFSGIGFSGFSGYSGISGYSGLGVALPVSVANGGTGVTTSTGTTNVVLSNSPTLVSPTLGTATFAAGTVALPSITTSDDTNTGVYFPAADTIAFTEGGAEAMRINSSGIVLIGTTAASGTKLLQVNSDIRIGVITAGFGNVGGNSNTAFGQEALNANTNNSNSAFGKYALRVSSTGNSNTAVGNNSLSSNTTGSGNTAVGNNSLITNSVGNSNSAFGAIALYNTTGSSNVGLGYSAGYAITTGTGNVIIGGYTGTAAPISTTGSNSIVFSDGAANVRQYYDGTNSAWVFNTGASERMRIDSTGNVGIGATANASAILDAQSTTKGVRMPNMTTTQKNAIATPAAGLMVYDTTLAKLCVYTTAWETITSL
jgi:hypothetical protein